MASYTSTRSSARDERGAVLALMAILLTTLCGCAGMVIDLGNWYLHIERDQKAAESAALAGAAFLPGSPDDAVAAARDTLAKNHFNGTISRIGPTDDRPDLMGVRVTNSVNSAFLQFFGYRRFTFQRSAVAGMRLPITMGSPNNVLGMETTQLPQWRVGSTSFGQAQFHLQTHGSAVGKHLGGRWDAGNCMQDPATDDYPDNCDPSLPVDHQNSEYEPDGQPFTVHVDQGVTGKLAVEIYDATYAPHGAACNGEQVAFVFQKTGNPRYDPDATDACPRDGEAASYDHASSVEQTVTVTMLNPKGESTSTIAECPPQTFAPLLGDKDDWWNELDPSKPHGSTSPYRAFRNWARVCTIDIGALHPSGDYRLFVKAATGSVQYNSFALRAAILNGSAVDTVRTASVSVYAAGRLTLNVHDEIKLIHQPLIHLSPSAAGRTVTLESYDLGDAKNPVPTMRLLPSSDSTVGGIPLTSFSCDWRPPASSSTQHLSSCALHNLESKDFSGRITTFAIKIPDTYTCDYHSKTGCWIILDVDYGEANVAADTSSWKLLDPGAPPRLYNASKYAF